MHRKTTKESKQRKPFLGLHRLARSAPGGSVFTRVSLTDGIARSLASVVTGHRRKEKPDLWYAGLLLVAGVVFFFDAIFSSKNFYFRDILNFHYPLHKVMIESYARGEFPLWNPYVYLGQPM